MADESLLAEVRALYPWAEQLGLIDLVIDKVRDDASPEEILAAIRQTPEWRAQFPAFYAEDGSKRFANEAQYMSYVDDLRGVMKDFGVYDESRESPMNYVGLIENGIDPNEFRDRLTTYRALETGTQELRDAFYVYAGIDINVDDVYRMTVDPGFQDEVITLYDERVTMSPPDYETYISRTTEVVLKHLAEGTASAIEAGVIPPSMMEKLINMDPNVARGWLDVIQTSSDRPLAFDELNRAFQYAMLASAATEQGFALPGKERIAEYVQAGVNRSAATRAYSQFAQQRYGLAGMAKRAGVQGIDQTLFEEATLLANGKAQQVLNKAMGREAALGSQGGGFASRVEGDRIVQAR